MCARFRAKKLNQALDGLNGTFAIADDIVIVGRGDTLDEAKRDLECNTKALDERCETKNIVLKQSSYF